MVRRVLVPLGAVLAGCATLVLWWALHSSAAPAVHAPADVRAIATTPSEARTVVFERGQGQGMILGRSMGARAIVGRVRSSGGHALGNASICSLASLEPDASPMECTLSDALGHFELPDARATARALLASLAGHAPRTASVPPAAERLGELLIVLEPGGTSISGKVLDASGGAIVGALLEARDTDGRPRGATVSLVDGGFSLAVDTTRVELSASAEGYSTDIRSIDAPYAGLVLSLTPESVIKGLIVAEGTSHRVPGLHVLLRSLDDARASERHGTSDENGAFVFASLTSGRYELVAFGAEWRSQALAVTVAPAETLGSVTLTVARAATLQARVLLTSGIPCAGASLDLRGPSPSSSSTDGDGNMTVEGLLPGRYEAVVACPRAIGITEALEVGSQALLREWRLDPGLTLAGTVVTNDGLPLAGATVVVSPVGEPLNRGSAMCTSDANGAFTCGGLMAGDYDCVTGEDAPVRVANLSEQTAPVVLRRGPGGALRVSLSSREGTSSGALTVLARQGGAAPIIAEREGGIYVFEHLPLGHYHVGVEECPDSNADVTVAREGEALELTLALPVATTISGSVVDVHGDAVAGAWVRAVMSGSEFAAFSRSGAPALSDGDGQFIIEGLLPRTYDLLVTGDEGMGELEAVPGGAKSVRIRMLPAQLGHLEGIAEAR